MRALSRITDQILPWLDVLAVSAWGALLLKYWLTGQLKLLIHPNYFWLVFCAGIILLAVGVTKAWLLIRKHETSTVRSETIGHITLFPPSLGSSLLLIAALLGFLIAPTILTSQTALQRGVTELPVTRAQPESFRMATQPEERSLIEWVRTLNAYPEPDAYAGQPAKVRGFVIHDPKLPDNYVLLSRFVITCCAVDAYPVGIPVKLEQNRTTYPPDTWLEVRGKMTTETLSIQDSTPQRRLVLDAASVSKIPTPDDPYEY